MGGVRLQKLFRLGLAGVACGTFFLAPGTAANGDPGAVSWQAPTPVSGSVVKSSAGSKLTIQLAAVSATPGALVTIKPAGRLPSGARLASSAGNPATAVLTWTPRGRDIGERMLRFTAVDNTPLRAVAQALAIDTQVGPGMVALSGLGNISRWAFVVQPTTVRSAPRVSAHAKMRLSLWTPENYPNLVLALQQRIARNGTWVQVRLPMLPNNSTGWIKRGALGALRVTNEHLIVDRAATTVTLLRNGTPVFSTRVGVGKSFWPTPRGEFYITEKITGFHNPAYGPIAFGTNARSSVLTDWPGGGFIGIHGTDAPGLIPGHISHGCVRLRNAAILRLARLMPVGTPLTIR